MQEKNGQGTSQERMEQVRERRSPTRGDEGERRELQSDASPNPSESEPRPTQVRDELYEPCGVVCEAWELAGREESADSAVW